MSQISPQESDELAVWTLGYLTKHRQRLAAVAGEKALPVWGKRRPLLGCGAYGCVYRTGTPGVVLKVTYDQTEGRFVREAIAIGSFPEGIVRYDLLIDDDAGLRGVEGFWDPPVVSSELRIFLLWREAASFARDTEEIREAVHEDLIDLANLINEYIVLEPTEQTSDRLRAVFDAAGRRLAEGAPRSVSEPVWTALQFYLGHGMLISDLHDENLGVVRRDGRLLCVITDPGRVFFLPEVSVSAERPTVEMLVKAVQQSLTPDLLELKYRKQNEQNPMYGHCYVASEALYHLLREYRPDLDFRPKRGRDVTGVCHWWLVDMLQGQAELDPTAAQYTSAGKLPPHATGRRGTFTSVRPSLRAAKVMERARASLEASGLRRPNPTGRLTSPTAPVTRTPDIDDAVEHYNGSLRGRPDRPICFRAERATLPTGDVDAWDDYSSWGEFEPGELLGMTDEEAFEALSSFRGPAWAAMAQGWMKNREIPPIVLVDGEDARAVGDGRGRVNLAIGYNLPSLPAVVLTEDPAGELCFDFEKGDTLRRGGREKNPLPKMDETRLKERPYGWAFTMLPELKQEAWQLGQLLWMISSGSWDYVTQADVLRRSIDPLLTYGKTEQREMKLPVMVDAHAATGKLLTIAGNVQDRDEIAFLEERSVLPRLAAFRRMLGEVITVTRSIVKTDGKAVAPPLGKLAAQELSIRLPKPEEGHPLELAPARDKLEVDRLQLIVAWYFLVGYGYDAMPPTGTSQLSSHDLANGIIAAGSYISGGHLTLRGLELLERHLATFALAKYEQTPINLFLLERQQTILASAARLLPAAVRVSFELMVEQPSQWRDPVSIIWMETIVGELQASKQGLTAVLEGRQAARVEARAAALAEEQARGLPRKT
jgi:hypothetical protein